MRATSAPCARLFALPRNWASRSERIPAIPIAPTLDASSHPWLRRRLRATVRDQIAALAEVAEPLGVRLVHCKPHGALYHAANKSTEVAAAIGRAVLESDEQLIMVGQAGSSTLTLWESMGLTCAAEAFADRAYEPDGILRKRTLAGALLDDPGKAAKQALDIATRHIAIATDGTELKIDAGTVCIHSDTPGSVLIARAVNEALKKAGVQVRPLSA